MNMKPRPQDAGPASADDDHALLRRASAGDEEAARRLFRSHVQRLHRHVSRLLGQGDPEVEDVVQQVFWAAFRGAERFDGRAHVGTWLFGIATRRALDTARARFRRQRWARLGEAIDLPWLGLGDRANTPDAVHAARSEADALLLRLHPDQRMVFLLHDVEGRTFAEIAAMTGIGISTLHNRLKAAHRRLDQLISLEARHGE
jgi:RNA polymerase sigma-70 factor (ECF subfamily)